jgi:hypothetical protein
MELNKFHFCRPLQTPGWTTPVLLHVTLQNVSVWPYLPNKQNSKQYTVRQYQQSTNIVNNEGKQYIGYIIYSYYEILRYTLPCSMQLANFILLRIDRSSKSQKLHSFYVLNTTLSNISLWNKKIMKANVFTQICSINFILQYFLYTYEIYFEIYD